MSELSMLPSLPVDTESQPLDWMLAMLRQAMEAVMAGDGTPLQKANALARLGALYLKTSGAAELKVANRELTRRLAEVEKQLAPASTPVPAGGAPARPALDPREASPRAVASFALPPCRSSVDDRLMPGAPPGEYAPAAVGPPG